ncbi:MAG: ribulose phosphate epimerase [Myxococcota bacterium]
MNLRPLLFSAVAAMVLLPASGCFDPDPLPAEDESGDTAAATDDPVMTSNGPGNTTTATTTATPPATTTATTTATTSLDGESTMGDDPSTGEVPTCEMMSGGECNTFAQDCPAGEKCTPYADDGGGAWNSTHCTPIADSPSDIGEPCIVEGSVASGIDNCVEGAMCWNVDPQTLNGRCIPLCGCDPLCESPDDTCSFQNEGVLSVCIPVCDPLLQDCPENEACYPVDDSFICALDASGEGGGVFDPCEFINACAPGLACINGAAIPGCGGAGCCTPFCELGGPASQCPAGTGCQAWFEPEAAPPGLEDVGICVGA